MRITHEVEEHVDLEVERRRSGVVVVLAPQDRVTILWKVRQVAVVEIAALGNRRHVERERRVPPPEAVAIREEVVPNGVYLGPLRRRRVVEARGRSTSACNLLDHVEHMLKTSFQGHPARHEPPPLGQTSPSKLLEEPEHHLTPVFHKVLKNSIHGEAMMWLLALAVGSKSGVGVNQDSGSVGDSLQERDDHLMHPHEEVQHVELEVGVVLQAMCDCVEHP